MSAPITLTGRLGQDPELRFSPSGVAVVRLSIVTSRRTKDEQGNWTDADTTWWDCTGFKQLAENVASSLEKGMAVIAVGRVVQENWEDKQTGAKRSKLALKLDAIGPDLNRATARVEKAQPQSQGGQQGQQPNRGGQQGGWGQQQHAPATGGGWGNSGQPASNGWGSADQSPPF